MNRRALIGAIASSALLSAAVSRGAKQAKIRPPGALPKGAFERACIGCFRCAEVCPTSCIRFGSVFSAEQTLPSLDLDERACILCMECTQVCPTGALREIPKDRHRIASEVRMGTPRLNKTTCLPWSNRGVCRLCFHVCPYPEQAITLVGPQKAPHFYAESCVGCGLCQEACPDDVKAIIIEPMES